MDMSEKIKEEIIRLSHDMANEDDLGAVIRGHIRIENLLSLYLSAVVMHPEKIEDRRFEYSARLAICLALGFRADLQGPLSKLGSIRNDFAHKPDRSISEKDCNDLISSFSAYDKRIFDDGWKEILSKNSMKGEQSDTNKDKLRMAIVTLWAACRWELSKVEVQEKSSPA